MSYICVAGLLTSYSDLPILKTLVLQTEHVPLVAGLPFFMVMACGLLTSRRSRHFMQYASTIFLLLYWLPLWYSPLNS